MLQIERNKFDAFIRFRFVAYCFLFVSLLLLDVLLIKYSPRIIIMIDAIKALILTPPMIFFPNFTNSTHSESEFQTRQFSLFFLHDVENLKLNHILKDEDHFE